MKHIFLDLDNTVTESRGKISLDMYNELSKHQDVCIVSGASREQILKQIGTLKCFILAQNGNDTDIWKKELTNDEREEIMSHINQFGDNHPDKIEDRGCQISYSFTGHNAPIELKKSFDPTGEKRQNILTTYPLESETIEVKIGGTTCLDYYPKGFNKGSNVAKFINCMQWDKVDCLYIGDALFKGGNDETVIGVIETHQVKNHLETLAFLKTI
jgi:phosphomannomutase